MFPFVHASSIYGNLLFVIDETIFWALVVGFVAVFAVAIPWLANRPMPTPWTAIWEESDRVWKSGNRRPMPTAGGRRRR